MLVFGALYYKAATHKKGGDSKEAPKETAAADPEKQPLKPASPVKA